MSAHTDPVIEASGLARSYRTRTGILRRTIKEVDAVRGVDFCVERGELFGLLGPNGAGKTTTIKMLITLLLPTAGSARVLGHDVVTEARAVRRQVGYVFGGERGSTSDSPRWTTSATSPSSTACRRVSNATG